MLYRILALWRSVNFSKKGNNDGVYAETYELE